MINFNQRLQDTWQRLRGRESPTENNPNQKSDSGNHSVIQPRSIITTARERLIASRLRHGVKKVQEHEAPKRDNLRPHSQPLTNDVVTLDEVSPSTMLSTTSPPQRPTSIKQTLRRDVRGMPPSLLPRSVANLINQSSMASRISASSKNQINVSQTPALFNHDFPQYDHDYPFQPRFFSELSDIHALVEREKWQEGRDYKLTIERDEDAEEDIPTMKLPGTQKIKEGWRSLPIDPTMGFEQSKLQLNRDAERLFKDFVPSSTRPKVTLPLNTPVQKLFSTILSKSNTLVIGECHSDLASKKAVIDSIPTLRSNGLTHFFLEHIPGDTYKSEITQYNASPSGSPLPASLEAWLDKLDDNYIGGTASLRQSTQAQEPLVKKYGFKAMVKAIHDGGIELCPIDREISYYAPGNFKGYSEDGSAQRGKNFNCLASQLHGRLPKEAKSAWFIGEAHSNTYQGIPGQAELNNGIAVIIRDKTASDGYSGLQANIKNYNGFEGLNPDLLMTIDMSENNKSLK